MPSPRIPNSPELWQEHPLGPPNRGAMAVYEIAGHRFAIGHYSQHTDPHILTITRHLVLTDAGTASHALVRLRRADGWVYVTNRRGDRSKRKQKRWLRTL